MSCNGTTSAIPSFLFSVSGSTRHALSCIPSTTIPSHLCLLHEGSYRAHKTKKSTKIHSLNCNLGERIAPVGQTLLQRPQGTIDGGGVENKPIRRTRQCIVFCINLQKPFVELQSNCDPSETGDKFANSAHRGHDKWGGCEPTEPTLSCLL